MPPHRFGASAALLAVVFVSAIIDAVFAASAAEDSASDATDPTGAWKGLNPTVGENRVGSDNGGFEFQSWNFAAGYHDPAWSPYGSLNHFIDGIDYPPHALQTRHQEFLASPEIDEWKKLISPIGPPSRVAFAGSA